MARFSKDTTIDAPADKVFAYVADFPRHSEWAQHNLEVMQTSSGTVGVGSTFSTVGHQFGTQRESQTVVDYSPGTRFAFESKGGLGVTLNAFDLAPADGGTRLTKSLDFVHPSLLARVTSFMVGRQVPKFLEEDLRRIKQRVEA